MRVDCIIVGQGICGSWLSQALARAGLSFLVFDEQKTNSASQTASGIINPVTGRRLVKTWMIDELLQSVPAAYQALEKEFGVPLIRNMSLIDFFPTPQMRLAFLDRLAQQPDLLQLPDNENAWRTWFQYDFGWGIISPCYHIDIRRMITAIREKLNTNRQLIEERFLMDQLQLTADGLRYRDIEAGRIIFCDGIAASQQPFFHRLPFAPNKGEALIVDIPGLPRTHLFKKGFMLLPWDDNLFWIGSSYEWSFTDDLPTAAFRERVELSLRAWLNGNFRIVEHLASVRPATLERRPFVGFHPRYPQVGLLNGMGTKGCSLAPYFAEQLARHIRSGEPILPEAGLHRFSGILSRPDSSA